MSLVNQTCWVVGGVGVIGRGITRGLLKAGATVIVNSREQFRLERLSKDLGHPERLELVKGSLLPGFAEATVEKVLTRNNSALHHVVAHGAVRYWNTKKTGSDETFSLDNRRLLGMTSEEFSHTSNHLAKLHFSAASSLLPRLEGLSGANGMKTSYTFVTGDGGGHISGKRSPVGELNSYHIWGLAAALRDELKNSTVTCCELRVNVPVNRGEEERSQNPRERPLSVDIGELCAGLACSQGENDENLIQVDSQESLQKFLEYYTFDKDERSRINLPTRWN